MANKDKARSTLSPLASYQSGTSEAAKLLQRALLDLAEAIDGLDKRLQAVEREVKKGKR